MGHYVSNKRWRLQHKEKRSVGRKRYYRKTAFAKNNQQRWTLSELRAITALNRPCDMVLSSKLGRSVQAIQKARWASRKRGG